MLLVDDLAAGGTKNLRHTPRGLVTLVTVFKLKRKHALSLKAPITTAADDKFCDIFPNLKKNQV